MNKKDENDCGLPEKQVYTSDCESEPELNSKMSKRKAANMHRKRG